MGYKTKISLINQGETVSPGVANRPLRELDENVKYLWGLIQAASLGSTVYARQVTVEADAALGMPVYYNSRTQRFERGLAQLETDLASGLLLTSATAQIWGVVALKHNATLADLLLFGYAELDLTIPVGGTPAAGTYYLSGTTAGGLTLQRPPISVAVLRSDGNGKVFLNPDFTDFLDSHRHYRFELWPFPAGSTTPPAVGERHVITSADATLRGWLPADHASFGGNAPAGAKFGYNLALDPDLQAVWPPLPASQAYVEWSHTASLLDGVDYITGGYQGVPMGLRGICHTDAFGIWWMSDFRGEAPWPLEFDSAVSESFYSEYEESEATDTDLPSKRIALWFTKLNLADEAMVVTKLASRDERLKIYCAGTTTEGTAGSLELDLDLNLGECLTDKRSPLAIKTLEGDCFQRGPVAEGLYALSDNLRLVGEASFADEDLGKTVYHGVVGIEVIPESNLELKCMLVRLEGATEENYPALYLGLPAVNESRFTALFEVPMFAAEWTGLFTYRVRLLGRVAGSLPTLTVEYMVVPRPEGKTPASLTPAWNALGIDTTATLTGGNQHVEADSDTFAVSGGDLIYVRVTRSPGEGDDSYASDVGILQQLGMLTLYSSTPGD